MAKSIILDERLLRWGFRALGWRILDGETLAIRANHSSEHVPVPLWLTLRFTLSLSLFALREN